MAFNVGSTTDDVVAGLDLTGSTIVVTGATSGLGLQSAKALASTGAAVVLTGRDDAKGAAAVEEVGHGAVFANIDLASLDAVRRGSDDLLGRLDRLDVLLNNAGVMACPLERTADGFEMQFGTNHLGHFLLTARLFPLLKASTPSRVVNLSSHGHMIGGVDLDDPNYERRDYDKWGAYGQAKTANVLFSRELDRRFGAQGLHAYAVHPGMIHTNLGRHLVPEDLTMITDRTKDRPAGGPSTSFKKVETGAATQVWAATGDGIPGGAYLADADVCTQVAGHATDDEAAARLWTLSEELVGEAFPTWD
jgi:NAD(P)-dependent dehydrogenase (short-subunit alcohol dehydrogenase family)